MELFLISTNHNIIFNQEPKEKELKFQIQWNLLIQILKSLIPWFNNNMEVNQVSMNYTRETVLNNS